MTIIRDLDRDRIRALAGRESESNVLSIYARTDPRDPANTNHSPAWEIELKNGLQAIEKSLEGNGDRNGHRHFRKLRDRVEREMIGMKASDRARSVAWFIDGNGGLEERFTLQIPVQRDCVVWDSRPYVAPLVDVVDRGAAAGIVAVNGDHIRLFDYEMGHVTEPENSTFDLSIGDWRDYQAYAAPNPARGQQSVSHVEHFEARLEEQRGKFFDDAAKQVSQRLDALGWERVVIAAEPQVLKRFSEALPQPLADRVAAELEFNIGHEEASEVASQLGPKLEEIWLDGAIAKVDEICEKAAAGGPAAVGPQETLGALGEGRVEHLFLDPATDLSDFAAAVPATIAGPAEMIAERAVEAAIASGAGVSSLSEDECPRLAAVGGMAAFLRY